MYDVSVVVPNYNGSRFLRECLDALACQSFANFETILVDNGSADESRDIVRREYPWVRMIELEDNFGFCRAVNEGIRASVAPYVILLNNDTRVEADFVGELLSSIKGKKRRFSCQAKMVQYHHPELIDDAGDLYCALGWAFARGKGKRGERYCREQRIFSSCGGASIYRKSVFEEIGLFDEEHFAYLEDMDVGYRARIAGYENVYAPRAVVRHMGSGTSGSRYNLFKVRYSSRNNVYLIYKNMPFLQILLNLPFLAAGFAVKLLFFIRKGYGREYAAGIVNGLRLCKKDRKVVFYSENIPNYVKIQLELWSNIVRKIL